LDDILVGLSTALSSVFILSVPLPCLPFFVRLDLSCEFMLPVVLLPCLPFFVGLALSSVLLFALFATFPCLLPVLNLVLLSPASAIFASFSCFLAMVGRIASASLAFAVFWRDLVVFWREIVMFMVAESDVFSVGASACVCAKASSENLYTYVSVCVCMCVCVYVFMCGCVHELCWIF
jgi:hypothetical protein